jgi:N-acetylneuraminic acid mutarotase
MKTTLSFLVQACLITGIIMLSGCKKEPGIPVLNTTNVSIVTVNTVVVSGTVTSDGGSEVSVRGVCWSTDQNPTITDYSVNSGAGLGSFTASINGLEPNTTYYVRAYARNSEGISYGNEVTFSTGPASLATLTTLEVSPVKATTAVSGGIITSDGGGQIMARGVCWSTDPNPTIADGITIGGTGSGAYISYMTGLSPNNIYYVRAYATNSTGTSYGNEVSFLTASPTPPALTTVFVQATATSAVVGGNINDIGDGVGEITDRGICWSTAPFPTLEGENLSNGAGPGSFIIDLINLSPGTTYFARAYAVNSAHTDVFYGNEISFVTDQVSGVSGIGFPGGGRYGIVSFAIGTNVYIGLGISNSDFPANDFWEWDPATRLWTRLANFPGSLGNYSIGFSIGAKGYVMSSIWSEDGFLTNTFWEYDPSANKWTQKASLPTTPARGSAVGFSIGTKGYVGIGFKELYNGSPLEYYNDFWEWDQATDIWTQKADFAGNQRSGAVGFSIGNKGYIGTGSDGTSHSHEFWEWDQTTDIWTQKADFAGGQRAAAVGFSIGNKGYIGTGINSDQASYLLQDFWEWDQSSNTWARVADCAGGPRCYAFGVSIGNKAYIGTGSNYNNSYLQDFWEYDPIH